MHRDVNTFRRMWDTSERTKFILQISKVKFLISPKATLIGRNVSVKLQRSTVFNEHYEFRRSLRTPMIQRMMNLSMKRFYIVLPSNQG